MGEIEQPVVVEAEQRAFQDRRQGQIVLRQQKEIGDRKHVHDRQLLDQHHAVGAGDLDAGILQRADRRVDQGVAPAHQDHDVAGARNALYRPVAGAIPHQAGRPADPGPHLPGDPLRQVFDRRCGFAVDLQRRPGLRRIGIGRGDDRPQFDHAALPLPPGGMAERRAVRDNAVPRRAFGEAAVHCIQHPLDRAEGHVEIDGRPVFLRVAHPFPEAFPDAAEHHRIGALEAEDRLFDVADGEHGARRPGQAVVGGRALDPFAGEEFPRDRLDQAPLLRAGVLRLVDQDMVDAAVQLVEHPFGRRRTGQQGFGLQDQVVEVQNGPLAFLGFIALVDGGAEPGQRRAAFDSPQGFLAVVQGGEPRGFPAHDVEDVRHPPDDTLRRQLTANLVPGGEKRPGVRVESGHARHVFGSQPAGDLRRFAGIRLAAAFQRLHRLREPVAVEPPFRTGFGVEPGFACPGLETGIPIKLPHRRRHRRFVLQQVAQPAALPAGTRPATW